MTREIPPRLYPQKPYDLLGIRGNAAPTQPTRQPAVKELQKLLSKGYREKHTANETTLWLDWAPEEANDCRVEFAAALGVAVETNQVNVTPAPPPCRKVEVTLRGGAHQQFQLWLAEQMQQDKGLER